MQMDEPRGDEPNEPSALERALRALSLAVRDEQPGGPPLDAPPEEAR